MRKVVGKKVGLCWCEASEHELTKGVVGRWKPKWGMQGCLLAKNFQRFVDIFIWPAKHYVDMSLQPRRIVARISLLWPTRVSVALNKTGTGPSRRAGAWLPWCAATTIFFLYMFARYVISKICKHIETDLPIGDCRDSQFWIRGAFLLQWKVYWIAQMASHSKNKFRLVNFRIFCLTLKGFLLMSLWW